MTKLTDKNTKAQILDGYNKLLAQLTEQANTKHDPAAEVKAKKTADTLSGAATTVSQSVEDQIAALQKTMQSVLINLSGSFADKVTEYQTVEEAIAIKKAELQEVHNIEVEAFSLAALVNTKKELANQFDEEAAEKRAQLQADLETIQTQISEARTSYQKDLQEQKEAVAKERKREEEEYEYNFNRNKKQREDNLNDQLAQQRKTFNDQKAAEQAELDAVRAELDKREEEVEVREEKMEDLEAAVAELPLKEAQLKESIEAELKSKYSKNAAIAESAIKKSFEANEKIYQNQIAMFEAKSKSDEAKITELQTKLDSAYEKIQSVALATAQRPSAVEYRPSGESK